MNKAKLIEEIKQNIPKGLNKIETAKYIYIKLGKEKAFDERYFFGNSKTKKQIYQMAERTRNNTDIVAQNRKIICVSLAYLYKDILKEFGIDSIVAEEGEHKYTIIYLNNMIKADLQLDLYNIQTKCKTEYFGTKSKYDLINFKNLLDGEMFKIDRKIGYVEKKEDYKDIAIKSIQEKVKDKSPEDALDIIFTDEELSKFENEVGFVEMTKFYKSILNKTVPKYLNKKIFSFNCYKENNNGEKEYTMCVYSEQKDNANVYLFSNKEKRFMKVELDKIEELENQGLTLGIRNKEKGTKRLKKIIERKKQKENNEKTLEK